MTLEDVFTLGTEIFEQMTDLIGVPREDVYVCQDGSSTFGYVEFDYAVPHSTIGLEPGFRITFSEAAALRSYANLRSVMRSKFTQALRECWYAIFHPATVATDHK